MKLTVDALSGHLQRGPLAGVYLLSGDEDLLLGEAADAIRAAARAQGYSEREQRFPERAGDWLDLQGAAQSMSLFGEQRIIELRFSGKPGKDGAAALLQIIEAAAPDILWLLITPRLDGTAIASAWVKAIEQHGVWVPFWPIDAQGFDRWLVARARKLGLELDADALALLATRVEGNLLAAQQELEKMSLLLPAGRVDAQAVLNAVAPSARYDVFTLGQAVVEGDATRSLRILAGLRGEGVEPTLVLWAVSRELRYFWALRSGDDPARLPGPRMPPAHRAALDRARPRAARLPFARLASRALRADRMIKGRLAGDPWDELALLCSECCGIRAV
jgi:DNA polymerase III subunit delta